MCKLTLLIVRAPTTATSAATTDPQTSRQRTRTWERHDYGGQKDTQVADKWVRQALCGRNLGKDEASCKGKSSRASKGVGHPSTDSKLAEDHRSTEQPDLPGTSNTESRALIGIVDVTHVQKINDLVIHFAKI